MYEDAMYCLYNTVIMVGLDAARTRLNITAEARQVALSRLRNRETRKIREESRFVKCGIEKRMSLKGRWPN